MVYARDVRVKTTHEILGDLEVYINVLGEKLRSGEETSLNHLAFIVQEMTKILADAVERETENVRRIVKTWIEDLEHIKTLVEEYNEGSGSLSRIWDYLNNRIDTLQGDCGCDLI